LVATPCWRLDEDFVFVSFDLKAVRIANGERRNRLTEFKNGEMVHRSFDVPDLALAGRLRLCRGDCNNKYQ
jgi:hypothetical protein